MTDPFTNKAEEILNELYNEGYDDGLWKHDYDKEYVKQALAALNKLHHEEVERIIGEDETYDELGWGKEGYKDQPEIIKRAGKDELRAEQRNRLNKGEQ